MIRTALEAAPVAEKAAEDVSKMGIGDAGITALMGYIVVFVGIVILIAIIAVFAKVMAGKKKAAKAEAVAETPAPAAPTAPVMQTVAADVGMKDGHRACDLYNVDDKTAVMLMAIVADEAGIPLNELRFISIKEL